MTSESVVGQSLGTGAVGIEVYLNGLLEQLESIEPTFMSERTKGRTNGGQVPETDR
jgi:hypothetical protein